MSQEGQLTRLAAGGDSPVHKDLQVEGAAALADEFAAASGLYFDNDAGRFASPHPDALDLQKTQEIVRVIEATLAGRLS